MVKPNEEMNANLTLDQRLGSGMAEAFRKAFPLAPEGLPPVSVTPSGQPEYGDYQCNAAMAWARGLRVPPREVARQVIEQAGAMPGVARLEAAGPGFINLALDDAWLAR